MYIPLYKTNITGCVYNFCIASIASLSAPPLFMSTKIPNMKDFESRMKRNKLIYRLVFVVVVYSICNCKGAIVKSVHIHNDLKLAYCDFCIYSLRS